MALSTVQAISAGGLNPAYATPNSSESIVPSDRQFLHVKNASGASMNVTVTDAGSTPAGNAGPAIVVAVPAAGERMIFLPTALANPSTGLITVAFSVTASITAALFRS